MYFSLFAKKKSLISFLSLEMMVSGLTSLGT
jgi:hypothetical protein